MTPSSEQLELFLERVRELDRDLAKLKGSEVRRPETIASIKSLCRDWLRLSEALRGVESIAPENLGALDKQLRDVLEGTNVRTRSSAYRTRLGPVLSSFMDKVVVPTIRYEGNPIQVAARQLLAEFAGKVTSDEQSYLEEAARCLASRCNRASIILLWAAAMSRLHSSIEKIGFNAFNEAVENTAQKKGNPYNRISKAQISSLPELQRSRDFDLLVVGMDLWKYDLQVFEELDRLLGLRNSAAHPGMLKPNALDVQQYATKLGNYVFDAVQA